MRSFRLLVTLLFIVAGSPLLCGEILTPGRIAPSGKFELNGYSFVIPEGDVWIVASHTPTDLDLVREGRSTDATYAIGLGSRVMEDNVPAGELTGWLRAELETANTGPRFRNFRVDLEATEHGGAECAEARTLVEDHGVERMATGRTHMILEGVSLFCRHPQDPTLLVDLHYTHRYYPGQDDKALLSTARAVQATLEFHAIEESDAEEPAALRETTETWELLKKARRFETGEGEEQDFDRALQLYEEAMEAGSVQAHVDLGWLYQEGIGVEKDLARARRLFEKAAAAGSDMAQLNLGVMYDQGLGVLEDDAIAVRWYRLAAEQGNGRAQLNLGVTFGFGGLGVPPNPIAGYKWLTIAARSSREAAVRRNAERAMNDLKSVSRRKERKDGEAAAEVWLRSHP